MSNIQQGFGDSVFPYQLFFLKKISFEIYSLLMCLGVLLAHMSTHHVRECPQKPEEGVRSPELEL